MGVRTGLNYAGCESVARMLRIPNRREVFAGLQVIEHELLQIEVKKHKKED